MTLLLLPVLMAGSCTRPAEVPPRRLLGVPLPLSSMWSLAELVSTGNTTGQPVVRKAMGASESPSGRVYVCEARFQPSVIVKKPAATVPARVLWYSYFPDCTFSHRRGHDAPIAERLWFFRLEGDLLRPLADDAKAFLPLAEILRPGGDAQGVAREELAKILLRQVMLGQGGGPESESFVLHYELACEIAGESRCRQIVRELQSGASLVVKREMCEMFWISYDYCGASECSRIPGYRLNMDQKSVDGMTTRRKSAAARSLVDSAIVGVFSSGRAVEIEALRQDVLRWVCHVDPEIRTRARAVLAKYFAADAQAPVVCVACQ